MSQLFYMPFLPAFTSRGLPAGAAQAYFYYTETTTLAPIYADNALSQRLPNPVSADALGRLPNIYMDEAIVYRVRILDVRGGQLGDDVDPYYPGMAVTVVPDLPVLVAPDGSSHVGFRQFGTGAIARTVQDKLRERVSIDDFGAIPDSDGTGTTGTDNTAAIAAAIASLPAKGGTVYIGKGIYRHTGINLPTNVHLVGEGSDSSVLYCPASGPNVTAGDGIAELRNAGLSHLKLLGTTASGFAFRGRRFGNQCVLNDIYTDYGQGIDLEYCYTSLITDSRVYRAQGIGIRYGTTCHNSTLRKTMVNASTGNGVQISGTYIIAIEENDFEFNQVNQVLIEDGRGVLIRKNYFEGLQPRTTGNAAVRVLDGDTVIIEDNYIDATQGGAQIVGSISGTTLTVTSISYGPILMGSTLTAPGIAAGTVITAFGTGAGGTGTYTVNNSQTVASEAILLTGGTGGFLGTDGTGIYCKIDGGTRIKHRNNAFASIDAGQTHVVIASSASDCEALVPLGSLYSNASLSSRVHNDPGDEVGVSATNSASQTLVNNTAQAVSYATEIADAKGEWTGGNTFKPKDYGIYRGTASFQILSVAANTQVNVRLQDVTTPATVSQQVFYFPAGSPSVVFDFAELLNPALSYQVQVTLIDGASTNRSLSTAESANRLAIKRVG